MNNTTMRKILWRLNEDKQITFRETIVHCMLLSRFFEGWNRNTCSMMPVLLDAFARTAKKITLRRLATPADFALFRFYFRSYICTPLISSKVHAPIREGIIWQTIRDNHWRVIPLSFFAHACPMRCMRFFCMSLRYFTKHWKVSLIPWLEKGINIIKCVILQ
jgi:hypothetical protein